MFRFLATADGLRPHWTRFPQGPTGNFARARLPTLLAAAGREIPEQALPGRPPSEPAGLLQLFSGFARRPDPLRAWLRPGFYRPPAAALSEPGAGAAEAAAARGVGAAPRTRARGVGGSLLPGSARPEPSRRCRPARSRRVPGLRATRPGRDLFRPPPPRPPVPSPRGREETFLALPARPAPVPAPPPPRVFRPSKDRATQTSLECPLPSGREGIGLRARAGHFQGASPEQLKVLFSP